MLKSIISRIARLQRESTKVKGKTMNEQSGKAKASGMEKLKSRLFSTSVAALLDRILLHPVDQVTTLRQKKTRGTVVGLVNEIYKKNGVIGFYKGLSYPIALSMPTRIGMFSSYLYTRDYIENKGYGISASILAAGAMSGVAESVVSCSGENHRTHKINSAVFESNIKKVAHFKGLFPLFLRVAFGNTVAMGGSDLIKRKFNIDENRKDKIFGIALLSGIAAQFFSNPFDVIKTHVMLDSENKGLWFHAKERIRLRDAYSGLGLRIIRNGLGWAIMLSVVSYFENRKINSDENPDEMVYEKSAHQIKLIK